MARIRGSGNLSTEVTLARAFRASKIKGWRRHVRISLAVAQSNGRRTRLVRPDFTFTTERVVVFVDGCFWHQCPRHSKIPSHNRIFWEEKLLANVRRDREVRRALKDSGWRVVRIWEHELENSDLSGITRRVIRELRAPGRRLARPPTESAER